MRGQGRPPLEANTKSSGAGGVLVPFKDLNPPTNYVMRWLTASASCKAARHRGLQSRLPLPEEQPRCRAFFCWWCYPLTRTQPMLAYRARTGNLANRHEGV